MEKLILIVGFCLSAYSVIANDAIQTLGTFIASNTKRSWFVLWLFAGGLLASTLIVGWFLNSGDVTYGRLTQIHLPELVSWGYLLPPIILLIITHFGLPVSTTFLILSVFSENVLIEKMILKSVLGYSIAFIAALGIYFIIEQFFAKKLSIVKGSKRKWEIAQWISTGILWVQWLIQDFANIYVFLPRNLSAFELIISLCFMLAVLAFIFFNKGGKIQQVVSQKTDTSSIQSATIIDIVYAVVLFFFTTLNSIPMSTTWVFIGILAGREFALHLKKNKKEISIAGKRVFVDLYRVNLGLIISILITYIINYMN